jgi:arylsulfatase
VPEAAAVSVKNRTHTITAHVDVPAGGAEGALLVQGSILGGWSFHLRGGQLSYVHDVAGWKRYRVDADIADRLTPGPHTLTFRFTRTEDHRGDGALLVDGAVVAERGIPFFTPYRFSITGAGLTCGWAAGLPPTDDYRGPFTFTGTLHRVVVDVDGDPYLDAEAEAAQAIARQ